MSETILQEAERLITGQRADDYGDAAKSFNDIAARWTVELGDKVSEPLTAFDVAHLMIQLKLSRAKNGFHRDSYVDIGGYTGLTEKLIDGEVVDAVDHVEEPKWQYPSEVPRSVPYVVDANGRRFSRNHGQIGYILYPVVGGYVQPQGPFTEIGPEPRVWDRIEDVPVGVKVTDYEDDQFHWEAEDNLHYDGAPWGLIGSSFNADLAPFTEVLSG